MAQDEERGRCPKQIQQGEKYASDVFANRTPSPLSGTAPIQRNLLARLRYFEARLDERLGIESEAIVRKRAEDKKDVSWTEELNMALIWASGNMNISSFAIGFLGQEFGLSLEQSILIIIFASILGGSVTAYCATFGPATGLRQMSVGRYSFGWWPNKVIVFLNCIQQIGWAAISCITGGLALTAVSDGRVSLILGMVILAVVALLISLVGLHAILVWERYAWIIFSIVFLIILGEAGQYADVSSLASLSGPALGGGILNLMATLYGASASWCATASDYYVHYRADVSRVKVFVLTLSGLVVPTSIGMLAGCVVASTLKTDAQLRATYTDQGLGYLVQEILYPRVFAKFLLTLLVLSGISMNVMCMYSAALSFQQLARPLALVPRLIWTLLTFACILGLSVGGREELNAYLQNFMSLLGYWCTSYVVILLEEHYVFRKGRFEHYDLESWNDAAKLPLGIGASIAFCLGVVSWCMGMSQSWFAGPLAKAVITSGGDVANELTLVVTALAYIPARYLELRYFGR